ncbi:MAG: acyl-CoA thioesterase [Chitinophagales bacterium]|nr:acyl-CoA thioesterase [Chitinophagales bacterium]MCB9021908.1 acyl-CoA thioesterase [Chitinophagales bacterium]MCB9030841.1 acyl-CoA thioesterase [Chitinophagales bacterium]HPE96854.1 acyl-CoA thioesterase [Chitinophagales bacterium]HPR27814.1 acyl-CoA thioesterase [Chitinophagales bacterium]
MNDQQAKKVSESTTIFTEIVMPNDTNPMNNLMGGNLLKWMDIASGICAGKHAGKVAVTAAVDNVSFGRPIKIGDVVTIEAQVTRAFNSSMEIYIEVFKENIRSRSAKVKCNEAYYTFVALDDDGRPCAVPPVDPQTDEEKHRFERAMRRRELRLILAGRMKPEEAAELKAIFIP